MNRDDRNAFFDDVYRNAAGDAAAVPWADLKPKADLEQWLAANPGAGRRAVDVACGLGDNAQALAAAGWTTAAFDLSAEAIAWARRRFPQTSVDYRVADLLAPPPEWVGAFDLVHECYTLQAVPPAMLPAMRRAVCALVRPGGSLLVYARVRPDGASAEGPPWPLEEREAAAFAQEGFAPVAERRFVIERHGRPVAHLFAHWVRKPG